MLGSLQETIQITVVACVSAAGYCTPPMVVWDRKNLSIELVKGEDTFYGLSENGWMDGYGTIFLAILHQLDQYCSL